MELGLYLGCLIPTEQYAYELSIREVFPKLGVELKDIQGPTCCGAPLRNINMSLTMYLSARNLALAEKQDLDILAPCPYCHQALTRTMAVLDENQELREKVNSHLADEDMRYQGNVKLYHVLDLLHDVVGVEKIKEEVEKPLEGTNIAANYGCHLIRPNGLERPDDSEDPQKMESLLRAIGMDSEDYVEKLDCCGAHVMVNEPESALTKTGQKLEAVQERGFHGMATMCPWGQRMFDSKQEDAAATVGASLELPVLYYTQLLGIAMGISPSDLGIELNLSPIHKIEHLEVEE